MKTGFECYRKIKHYYSNYHSTKPAMHTSEEEDDLYTFYSILTYGTYISGETISKFAIRCKKVRFSAKKQKIAETNITESDASLGWNLLTAGYEWKTINYNSILIIKFYRLSVQIQQENKKFYLLRNLFIQYLTAQNYMISFFL